MQINSSKTTTIASKIFSYLGWILLFLLLWFKGCSKSDNKSQIITVEVPEVVGKFKPQKPVSTPIYIKGDVIKNPINEKLLAENEKLKVDFVKATDSIKELLYNNSIQLNHFSSNFEDENLVLNINGIVQGEVKEITPNYTIKEKKIEIPVKQKETVFRLLGGVGLGTNKELNQFMYKLDLGFQNKKGDIISAEYINIKNNNFGMIGYKKSILNIKR